MMNEQYTPSYRITPGILHSIEQIGEALGNLRVASDSAVVPILRRGNRIKTVQASLAIEGNSLSLEQITAVLAGKGCWRCPVKFRRCATPLPLTRNCRTGPPILARTCLPPMAS